MRPPFQFKEFIIHQEKSALPVTTDACIFGALTQFENPEHILDMGCGTGLLSFFMNQKYPNANIIGIDSHQPSVEEAKKNVICNNKSSQINIYHCDFFEFTSDKKFHIICNPPFFENQLKSESANKIASRHFDKNGFETLIQKIATLLDTHSKASLLIPTDSIDFISILAQKNSLNIEKIQEVKHNQNKKSHVAILSLVKYAVIEMLRVEIVLKDMNQKFLTEIREILSPFYLDQAL